MKPLPRISVCILAYQHAGFIAQAIDGALMQKTSFPFEILIGEDESTDGTRDICLDYARRHPEIIRVFLRNRRDVVHIDGRPRGSFNFRMTVQEAKGEFIALCEGDDYWTDEEKLQRQLKFLEANPDCTGCFHDAKLVDGENQTIMESYFQSDQDKFTQKDVLETLLSREPTCSLLFRRSAFAEPLPEWYLRRPSDLYLDILLTQHGSLGFVRRNMGAYRKHSGGIWGGQRESFQIMELITRYKLLLADPLFLGKYRDILLRKIDEFQATLFTRQDMGTEIQRLEKIVCDQNSLLLIRQSESNRLTSEAQAIQREAEKTAEDAQKHVDTLMKQLACTAIEHQKTIKILRNQIDQLAATSQQQAQYISVIENERHRLATLAETHTKEIAHYAKVMKEQAAYIKELETQRSQSSSPAGS